MKTFVICIDKLLRSLFRGTGNREKRFAQIFQRNVSDLGKSLRHGDILFGTGRRLEHDGIRENGGCHQTGNFRRRNDAEFLIHPRQDRIGAADRFIAHRNRLDSLNIRKAVVIDNLHNLHLFQTGNRLSRLVMVDQDDFFAPRTQQVKAGERTDYMLLFVKHGVAAETAFEKDLADVVKIIVQMETDNIFRVRNAFYRDGLINDTGNRAPVKRRGDNAWRFIRSPFRLYFRLTQDNAGSAVGSCLFHRVRLIAADENPVFAAAAFISRGKGDHHVPRNGVDSVVQLIHNPAFNHTQKIEKRKFFNTGIINCLHIIRSYVPRREHAVQGAVIIQNGKSGNFVASHRFPGQVQRDSACKLRRMVKIKIADLRTHILNIFRRINAEHVQQAAGFVVDRADADGFILPHAESVSQRGIGEGSDDRISVRVAVPGYEYFIHNKPPDK